MKIHSKTEMTLRAVVNGKNLGKVRLRDPIELSRTEAEAVAAWARPFSGTCMTDLEIHVSDIRPSSALMVLSDLPDRIAKKIKPALVEARRYGFGLRLMRETSNDPYELVSIRRVLDAPQLTITARSLRAFLEALGFLRMRSEEEDDEQEECRMNLEQFADRLRTRHLACMDAGVAHYREFSMRIVEYGEANGASEIVWGPERRGAVTPPANDQIDRAA